MKKSKAIEVEDELEESKKPTKEDLDKVREKARENDLLQLLEADEV